MPKTFDNIFDEISDFKRLRRCFYKASKSKFYRYSIIQFNHSLEENILKISEELKNETYEFGNYRCFYVHEPKKRLIESACFRDRVVHHSIHQTLEPIFDNQFSTYSYACRTGRGHHRAALLMKKWISDHPEKYFLKCDIKKFFPSIDRDILFKIISKTIIDERLLRCLKKLIANAPNHGIPIGNLTSQLFANIYLNELDQFVKRKLKVKKYIRYMDDFIMLADSQNEAQILREKIEVFITESLNLTLSPQKVQIAKCRDGVSFLGFFIRPNEMRLRGAFFRRMKKKLKKARIQALLSDSKTTESPKRHRGELHPYLMTINSYLGHVKFCTNSATLKREILKVNLGLFKESVI
ncbi:MAG: hypothetical protein B7Y39_10945 [Bdellovibrio sp. 28-41-41]|nr:MAG: hypothetical protein B7Y39_10945 [Bdellovibrio sp. 28-41-41]